MELNQKRTPIILSLDFATWFAHISVIMSEEQDQNNSLIDESDNDSEPAVHHQMNPRVEAKINALCQQTGLIMKQVNFVIQLLSYLTMK